MPRGPQRRETKRGGGEVAEEDAEGRKGNAFLDTGILVGAILGAHPEHAACLSALEDCQRPFTNAHALAETFATLRSSPPEASPEPEIAASFSAFLRL